MCIRDWWCWWQRPCRCVSQPRCAAVMTLCCPPEAAHNEVPTVMIIYNSFCLQHLLTWFATSGSDVPPKARWYFCVHSRDWLGAKLIYCWMAVCFKIPQKCRKFTVCHPPCSQITPAKSSRNTTDPAARLKPKRFLPERNIPLHFK